MISIIIPTLNEEKILKKSLVSLKSHLTVPHEIIVTDGKSTDKTIEIAREYADQVVVHDGKERQTIAGGRNAGATVAKGDILMFLDADCTIFHPDLFLNIVREDFEEPHLVAVTGWLEVLPHVATIPDRVFSYIVSFVYMAFNNFLHIGAATGEIQIIRRSSFEKVGGYNASLVTGEDVDLFYRLSKIGDTKFDNNLVVYHTGRRAHKVGWLFLLWAWFKSTVWMLLRGKSPNKEWKVIR